MGSNLTSLISNCSKKSLRWACSTVPALRQRIGVEESACQLHNMTAYGCKPKRLKQSAMAQRNSECNSCCFPSVSLVRPRSEKRCFCHRAVAS